MESERALWKGNMPTLVLAVLRDGPLHGYAIARAIERRSGEALRCKEGTLYPALQGLERDGLISGEWQRDAGARERRVYTITPAGLAALEQRAAGWARFAAAVQRVMAGDEHGAREDGTPGTAVGPVPRPAPSG